MSNNSSRVNKMVSGASNCENTISQNNRKTLQTKASTSDLFVETVDREKRRNSIAEEKLLSENETLRQEKVDLLGRIRELEEKQNKSDELIRKLELELASFRNRESMEVTDSKTELILNEITNLSARNQDMIFNYMLEIIPNENDSESELFISLLSKSVYKLEPVDERQQISMAWDKFNSSIMKRLPNCYKLLIENKVYKDKFFEILKNCQRISDLCEQSRIPKIRMEWGSSKAGMECICPGIMAANRVIVDSIYSKYF
ncbi:predicted protein [Naegleria gruberi]|uniref:Predicted protein n=1 Tax=Naegleria gruberi TaxID=5762 RepID=D2W670_NAEGR|nr:uncharacterized protein NAEGRDRAFT_76913 [Naegleria gruberi]EFC35431.1 predicted protein [Naegleria gruberi]|eukprot:XP_002668175.1 predicted protein [Naegleria gruberi strain NEG-M]